MGVLLLLLVLIAILGFTKRLYSLVVFSLSWIASVLFVGYSDYSVLSDRTHLYLLIMILSITTGILISHYHYSKIKKQRLISEESIKWNTVKFLLIVCMLIFLYYFTITIRNAGGINLNLIRSINSADSDDSAFQGYGATLLFFMISQPLFTAISIVLIYSYYHREKAPKYIWTLFVICAFLFLVTNAGRIFIIIILSFFLAGFFANRTGKVKIVINYKKIGFYLLMVFFVLNVMTKSRNSSAEETISFVQQAKEYVGCSILNMDYELKELKSDNPLNCGYYAYGGFLYYPIKLCNIFLGTSFRVPADNLEYLQQVKIIEFNGRSIMYNALVPNAFYYYFDSGILGIFLFSILAGLLIGKYEVKTTNGIFLYFALYAIGIYYLLFSPMGSQMWKTYMPMTIVWSIILSKYCLCKRKYQL